MLHVQLQIAARRRGTTVTALGKDLLTAICTDNLVDAVLGDLAERANRKTGNPT